MILKDILKKLVVITACVIVIFLVSAFAGQVDDPYSGAVDFDYSVKRLQSVNTEPILLGTNTDTVVPRNASVHSELVENCLFALMVGESDNQIYVAKNVHKRMYPASMTKLMTAICVCDQLDSGRLHLDDVVTLDKNYDLTSEGVGPCELYYGCRITVKNLMYGLMLESNNYYALILADYISGGVEEFAGLMNEKAQALGATNTHFANPHGLDDPDHYTTAYDIYLIIKEAYNRELIRRIDEFDSYAYSYFDPEGNEIETETSATNYFVNGGAELPSGVKLLVWKTGTTDGAGNCLALYFEKDGKKYVAVASALFDKLTLYTAMARMLSIIY